jgi:glycogen debranching enzyme
MNRQKTEQKSVLSPIEEPGDSKLGDSNEYSVSASSSLSELKPLVLKHGNAFGVFDSKGDAIAKPGGSEGVYYCDTRHLSHFAISLNERRPIVLSSTLRDDNATLTCDLANPGLVDDDGLAMDHDLIHVRRTRFLWKGSCFERLRVRNFDLRARSLRLAIRFASDFADLFEVRGMVREKRGQAHDPEIRAGQAMLSYTGLDDRLRSTTLRFDPAPDKMTSIKLSSAFIWDREKPVRSLSRSIVGTETDRRSPRVRILLRSAPPGENCDRSRLGPSQSQAPMTRLTKPRGAISLTSIC